jgi:hypothetical protein
VPLKVGILIARSLYWRANRHREKWRDSFLHKDHVSSVNAPIRYGRLSLSKTYTMVYAPGTPLGKAKVVACNRDVTAIDELVDEAAALWAAEQRSESHPIPGQLHSGH